MNKPNTCLVDLDVKLGIFEAIRQDLKVNDINVNEHKLRQDWLSKFTLEFDVYYDNYQFQCEELFDDFNQRPSGDPLLTVLDAILDEEWELEQTEDSLIFTGLHYGGYQFTITS